MATTLSSAMPTSTSRSLETSRESLPPDQSRERSGSSRSLQTPPPVWASVTTTAPAAAEAMTASTSAPGRTSSPGRSPKGVRSREWATSPKRRESEARSMGPTVMRAMAAAPSAATGAASRPMGTSPCSRAAWSRRWLGASVRWSCSTSSAMAQPWKAFTAARATSSAMAGAER
jgi:hypothetical protein